MEVTRFFSETSLDDVPLVGGKGASLGELYRALSPLGVPVSNGFSVTAAAFRQVLKEAGITADIQQQLDGLDPANVEDLARRGAMIRGLIETAPVPGNVERAILAAYEKLSVGHEAPLDVAVRSSATAEDLPDASFAGQHDSYLHIQGDTALMLTVRKCWASLFTDRAISYRIHKGFDHMAVALAVCVQQMIRADLGTSGVMFTLDTETGFDGVVLINAAYGLGENVVQGTVSPDEFYVFKGTLDSAPNPIVRRALGAKQERMVYADTGAETTKNLPVSEAEKGRFCLTDAEVITLARHAMAVESHYSRRAGHPVQLDLEWARDGADGPFYIIQARSETVHSKADRTTLLRHHLDATSREVIRGIAIGGGIASGIARVIHSGADLPKLQPGEILVSQTTDPAWEPVMKTAAGIITDKGGRTCHAAIVSRELGLTAVVGTGTATQDIKTGDPVTLQTVGGGEGIVFEGLLPFHTEKISLAGLQRPNTRIMMNLGNPNQAFHASQLPNDGVGLARLEFIISAVIRIHPSALLHPERVIDAADREQIKQATRGYDSPTEYFVQTLAEGVGTIGAAFYPKPVIVRLSDFKSNEYADLVGGRVFEPVEENPMLGFRGASRYISDAYREEFGLECQAILRVREQMGLTNVKVMIPFLRTVAEGKAVLARMAEYGLKRGDNGLEVYVMCEIPANVILAEEFLTHFDGFSIGSNDLTQLTLGVDRDSELVANVFDERNDAVKKLISQAIDTAHQMGKHIGICGQAPSDYPDFAEFLVREGIESMSLTPDAILPITKHVLEVEKNIDAN
jgi:pyruvate,water dikinase